MNPEVDPNTGKVLPSYVCGAEPSPDIAAAVPGELIAAKRNGTTVIADRKFHHREDLFSQPQYGDMFSNLTASYDAIFWPIHVNVDRTWWEWQTQHPTGLPTDLDAVLSPWSYTVRDMLEISRFGYEYVRCSYFMPVGMEAPIATLRLQADPDRQQGEEIPQGRDPAALGAAAAALLLRARLRQPAGRGRHHAGAQQSALCGLPGDLRSRRMLRRSGPLRPAAAARARLSTSARAATTRRATTASTSRRPPGRRWRRATS